MKVRWIAKRFSAPPTWLLFSLNCWLSFDIGCPQDLSPARAITLARYCGPINLLRAASNGAGPVSERNGKYWPGR